MSPEITAPGAAAQVPARIQAGVRHAASKGEGPGAAPSARAHAWETAQSGALLRELLCLQTDHARQHR